MKRITLFAGHYGSGKTSIAVSYAKYLKKNGKDVKIIDLDIVNPYFRTKDSEADLKECGIELISSEYANTNLDAPALPKEIYSAICNKDFYLVIDVGGDDRGAVALGRYAPDISNEDYEMLFVANCYRPLTKTAEDAFEIMKEIEIASKLPFTAIVNNSNIGDATASQDIINSVEYIKDLSKISGLPIKMTTSVKETDVENNFIIELQSKYYAV